jgi:hypothetical protein
MTDDEKDLERIKYKVLDYLVKDDIIGAVRYVRTEVPIVGLRGAMAFVNAVKKEVGLEL